MKGGSCPQLHPQNPPLLTDLLDRKMNFLVRVFQLHVFDAKKYFSVKFWNLYIKFQYNSMLDFVLSSIPAENFIFILHHKNKFKSWKIFVQKWDSKIYTSRFCTENGGRISQTLPPVNTENNQSFSNPQKSVIWKDKIDQFHMRLSCLRQFLSACLFTFVGLAKMAYSVDLSSK